MAARICPGDAPDAGGEAGDLSNQYRFAPIQAVENMDDFVTR